MSVTDEDRDRAREVVGAPGSLVAAIAAALAAEREHALASCYGRHEPVDLVVTGPGLVTCNGHTLAFRTEYRDDPQSVDNPVETAKLDGRRQIRIGETTDIAPHEVIDVVTGHGIPLLTIDGGTGGMRGVRFG